MAEDKRPWNNGAGRITLKQDQLARYLPDMMYGFGDARTPSTSSVNLMAMLVTEYIAGVTTMALDQATERGELSLESFMYVLNSDRRKRERVRDLLQSNKEIAEARKDNSARAAKRLAPARQRKRKPTAAAAPAVEAYRAQKRLRPGAPVPTLPQGGTLAGTVAAAGPRIGAGAGAP